MERAAADHYWATVLAWVERTATDTLVLACPAAEATPAEHPTVVADVCPATVPLYRVADLVLAGIRTMTVAQDCPHGPLAQTFAQNVRPLAARLSLSQAGPGTRPVLRPGTVPRPRRVFLRKAQPDGHPWPDHAETTPDSARLAESLRALDLVPDAGTPAGVVLAANGCTACGVCVRTCPTGALTITHDGNRAALAHAADTCAGTGDCAAVCPEAALTITGPQTWADVVAGTRHDLATVVTRTCARCQATCPATDGDLYCPTCQARIADPFGSVLPPAAEALLRYRERRG